MQWTYTIDQIKEIATSFWKATGNATVFAFHGEMGSGKTTFIHALCDVRKVQSVVGSPTFSIINEYRFHENGDEKKIFHLDLYRLRDDEEARQAGVEDCLYSGELCMVEWPEKGASLIPDDALHVHIQTLDDKTRSIIIKRK